MFDNPSLPRVNPEYCHCPHSSENGCSPAIGRSGPPPGCISSGSGVPLSTRLPRISTSSAIGDLAATEKTEFNDPDWTVGVKLGRDRSGGYWLLDMVRARANPGDVEQLLINTATQDGKRHCQLNL